MSTKISIKGIEAEINSGLWSCVDKDVLRSLNDLYPSGALPDEVNAKEAIQKLGGSFVSIATNPDDQNQEGVYLPIH